jgi:hypothetical protein
METISSSHLQRIDYGGTFGADQSDYKGPHQILLCIFFYPGCDVYDIFLFDQSIILELSG